MYKNKWQWGSQLQLYAYREAKKMGINRAIKLQACETVCVVSISLLIVWSYVSVADTHPGLAPSTMLGL